MNKLNDRTSTNISLSSTGRQRRDDMLTSLQDELTRVHRRRGQRRRLTAGLAVVVVSATAAVVALRPSVGPTPSTTSGTTQRIADASGAVRMRAMEVTFVTGIDHERVARWTHEPTRSVEIIDDATLLAQLRELDRPTGLVRSEGKVWLTADVTTMKLNIPDDTSGDIETDNSTTPAAL